MTDLYEVAVREWVARHVRDGDRKRVSRDDIRDIQFCSEHGFHGSEVTPPEPGYTAVSFELRRKIGFKDEHRWRRTTVSVEHLTPVTLVHDILAVYHQLLVEGPE